MLAKTSSSRDGDYNVRAMKPIAVTLGDPAGIGTEVVFKALAEIDQKMPIWVFGDWRFAQQMLQQIAFETPIHRVFSLEEAKIQPGNLLFIDVRKSEAQQLRYGTIDALYGSIALASIDLALDAIHQGLCTALVTAPLNKQAIAAAGSSFRGHTELLASKNKLEKYGRDFAMYFDSPSLRVVLLTVHVPLSQALQHIDPDMIVDLAALTERDFMKLYKKKPRIGVAGVNPHAGEGGMMGTEEKVIAEAVHRAAANGHTISGPFAPDTIFLSARQGKFDVVMAIYHDQGLIPVKTVHFDQSVNITLGLPYLRASVDHGTAFDIAGKGIANHNPMRYAIGWTAKHAEDFFQK